jgi:hypothetical protein
MLSITVYYHVLRDSAIILGIEMDADMHKECQKNEKENYRSILQFMQYH